mgnify:CR=1 FL=1|jgi:hypothetical protein
MFNLSLQDIQRLYPVAGSFDTDDFKRYEEQIKSYFPFGNFFDWAEIEKQYGNWDGFLTQYLEPNESAYIDSFRNLPARIALRTAIPHTDLVISKGGLFVTDADGVTPASTSRVERLLKSLDEDIEKGIWNVWLALQHLHRNRYNGHPTTCITVSYYKQGYCSSLPLTLPWSSPWNKEKLSPLAFFASFDEFLNTQHRLAAEYLSESTYQFLCRMNSFDITNSTWEQARAHLAIEEITGTIFLLGRLQPDRVEYYLSQQYDALKRILTRDADAIHYDRTKDPAGVFHKRHVPDGRNFIV